MSINTAAPTAEQTPPKAMPDFSHRLACDYEPNCPDALVHDVETMLERSKGMLNILSDLHLETHIGQINPDNVSWAIRSVVNELNDVLSLVSTYRDSVTNTET